MAKKVKEKELKNLSFEVVSEVDKSFNDSRFTKVKMRVAHDGVNPNMSHFGLDAMESAKDSLVNIPILANVVTDEDGNLDFGAHDVSIEEHKMKEGEYKLIYKETPIGLIPFDNEYAIEEFEGRNYVTCVGYLWNEYSNYSIDILETKEENKLSMEIMVESYEEWSEDKKYFDIKSYKYTGITFLGDKYGTGMLKAKAEKVEFNLEDSKEMFISMANELKFALEESNKASEDVVENASIDYHIFENEGENVTLGNEGDVVVVEETVAEDVVVEPIAEPEVVVESIVEETIVEPEPTVNPEDYASIEKVVLEELYSKIADYEKQIESFKADIDNKDKTIVELTTFKTNVEKEIKASQVEELLGEFEAVLKDDESFVELKSKGMDMEIAELEKELYALEGKLKHEKKNKAKDKKFNYSRVIVDVEGLGSEKDKEDVVAKYYGEASKYFKK